MEGNNGGLAGEYLHSKVAEARLCLLSNRTRTNCPKMLSFSRYPVAVVPINRPLESDSAATGFPSAPTPSTLNAPSR